MRASCAVVHYLCQRLALHPNHRHIVFFISLQVEYAHEMLEDLHPLAKTDIREAFPWLGAVTCYTKKSEDDFQEGSGPVKNKKVTINGKEVVKKQIKKKKNPIGSAVV